MNKYKSVVVFIICNDDVLMLNRNKKYWMGMWNSVGGKIISGETPLDAAKRETLEETGLDIDYDRFLYLAILKWTFDGDEADGAYCYLVYLNDSTKDEILKTPIRTDEGILEWKKLSWVLNKDNRGVVPDIYELLNAMLKGTFKVVSAYYNKEDHLYKIEVKEGENMDKVKENLKKAGYAAVGMGAKAYEKGKEIYEKVAPSIKSFAEKGEAAIEKAVNNFGGKYDEFAQKGEEVLNKNKKEESEEIK